MVQQPLHLAASQADIDAVRRELGEGVSPNVVSDGLVPLQYLCCVRDRGDRGDTDNRITCFNILVDAGADVNFGLSSTPLSLAAGRGSPKLVAALINAGANVNWHNSTGWTPLHLACRRYPPSLECVELLLNAGAAVNATTDGGRTTLDVAINRQGTQERIYPTLLRAGAGYSDRQTTDAYMSYLRKVRAAGGIRAYERTHLNAIAATFIPKLPLLPPEMVRRVVEYAFHVGDY
jgi:ankyrin repeat protein